MRIEGLLLDLEGVVYEQGVLVAGARQAIEQILEQDIPVRFLTNTTTRPQNSIARQLTDMGLNVRAEHIFTPSAAACRRLGQLGIHRIHLAAEPDLDEDFTDFDLVDNGQVEAVLMGDIFRKFDWETLNQIFVQVSEGALLIGFHKNRYCRRDGEIALDLGPFVAALEYAANVEAEIIGKPSQAFFNLVLDDMGTPPNKTLMVGDDIEADIGGAQNAGLIAVQVETGKYTPRDLHHPTIKPQARIPSISELPRLLERL